MRKMILQRLISLIVILFGLSILTFSLTYLLPSDPIEELVSSMGVGHDEEMIARLEENLVQTVRFWNNMRTGSPVWSPEEILVCL